MADRIECTEPGEFAVEGKAVAFHAPSSHLGHGQYGLEHRALAGRVRAGDDGERTHRYVGFPYRLEVLQL